MSVVELLAAARDAAAAGGEVLLRHFESDLEVETKSNAIDLVTVADRAAEAAILESLRRARPDDGIVAEESGEVSRGGITWWVDPLDGTTNFAHTFPHFSVSIAAFDGDDGLVGLVHDPVRGEWFEAARGHGARLRSDRGGDKPLRVSTVGTLDRALLATGFAYRRSGQGADNIGELAALLPSIHGVRRAGSAALDLAYIAAGRLDGYWERHLSPWDMAAGAVLVREAGGDVRTATGDAWAPTSPSVAAANPALLDALLDALR